MPDILDFATACPDKSYKEQVMERYDRKQSHTV